MSRPAHDHLIGHVHGRVPITVHVQHPRQRLVYNQPSLKAKGARRATPARRGLLDLRDEWLLARRLGREHPRGPQAGDAVVIDVAGANPTLRTSTRKGAHTYYLSSEHLLKVR